MIAVQPLANRWRSLAWKKVQFSPPRAAWWSAYTLILLLSAVAFWRSLAISFQPLSTATFLLISLLTVASSILLRGTGSVALHGRSSWQMLAWLGSLSIASLFLALSITASGTSLLGAVAGWSMIVAAEANWWTLNLASRRTPECASSSVSGDSFERHSDRDSDEGESIDETWPQELTQQISRMRNATGGETLAGGVRVDFSPGERQQAVHIAFCPPLERRPVVHVEQSEGRPATVEVTQLEPFGVRLEAKLDEAATATESLVVQFEAICSL